MPCPGLHESHKISYRSRKVQDVRPLQEGMPDGGNHVGEKDACCHQYREVRSLSVLYPGVPIQCNRIMRNDERMGKNSGFIDLIQYSIFPVFRYSKFSG